MKTLQDVRYAFRMLLKRPGFTVIVVLTLALGIGANTTIFSAIDAVLLNPLPYKNPERLLVVWETNKQLGPEMWDRNEAAIGNFLDWRSHNQIFDQLGALFDTDMNLTGVGEPQRIKSCVVTTNFFQVLGVQPMLGRSFLPEAETPGSPFTVIISHDLWERQFGSDPNIINKSLTLNAHQVAVIGVMPPGFELQFPTSKHVDMWVPMIIDVGDPDYHDRNNNFLYTLGRLKQGVSPEQAQTEMSLIASQLQQQYPETNAEKGVRVVPLQKQLVGNVESYLYMLFAAVGFLLLIACTNVAGLLLSRVTARHREVAIRIAVGASRWRLIRQLLTESVILSALSGLFGLLLAYGGVKLLLALTPSDVPRLHEIGLHVPVFLWTLTISIATGVLFGLAPAIQASRPDLNQSLKESSGRNPGGSRLRNLLVVSEVAVALLLLVGAGLMTKSFVRLQQVDPGFEPANVISMNIALPTSKYRGPQVNNFYDQLFERVKNLPGVKSVAGINPLPLSNSNVSYRFVVEGAPFVPLADRPYAGVRVVTPGYFQTMNIRQLKGRAFTEQDRENTPYVTVINEALASRYWPNQDPLGKRLGILDEESGKQEWREIVGVVGNVRHKALEIEVMPEAYFPYKQSPQNFMSLVVRTASDPSSLVAAIRSQVLSVDKDQPVSDVMTMEQRVARSVASRRFVMLLLGSFSVLALGMAAVGIYGVMAYLVIQRTQEIGIRMALGAQKRDVLKLVVGKGMALALIGAAIGLVASLFLTRLMRSLLFEVTPTDGLTFVIVSVVLLTVALLACYIPARRATRVDPLVALRYE
ncbi:MAG TPA: ABC transporter permease [Pyrinomonadaceae bacterium]|nr:ABC transporter permease [Pyrinomonadaceae bacterium]